MPEPASNADEYALQAVERLQEAAQFVRNYTGRQIQRMKERYDASLKPKHFVEDEEILLFDPQKKRGQFTKWSVTWVGPFVVKKHLNDCNYVIQKSAKSRPFVVHVDRMCRYLHDQADSVADTSDKPPVSDTTGMLSRLLKSPGRKLRGRGNANTSSEPTITDQSVKLSTTARTVDSTTSSPTDGAPATAVTAAPAAEVIDSIIDTDTAVANMSGARPASTSTPDKPTLCSDTTGSNIQVSSASSDADVAGAQDLNVSVDVKNRPRPPRPIRPQRIRRKPARLIDQISARQVEGCCRQPFRVELPYLLDVRTRSIRSLRIASDNSALVILSEMASRKWKSRECVSETSESSSESVSSMPTEARARSPALTPPLPSRTSRRTTTKQTSRRKLLPMPEQQLPR